MNRIVFSIFAYFITVAVPSPLTAGMSAKTSGPTETTDCKRKKIVATEMVRKFCYPRVGCTPWGKRVRYDWIVTTYRATYSDGSCRLYSETKKRKNDSKS